MQKIISKFISNKSQLSLVYILFLIFNTNTLLAQTTKNSSEKNKKDCENGTAEACYLWGNNEFLVGDAKSGFKAFEKGCTLGKAECCEALGVLSQAVGNTQDAKNAFKKGCASGDGLNCSALATVYEQEGEKETAQKEFNTAARAFRNQCEKEKHEDSCQQLDLNKHTADAFPENKKAAEIASKTSATDGLKLEDIKKLSADYLNGLRTACSNGDGQSCRRFGVILLVQNKLNEAKVLFEISCKLEDGGGCVKLAVLADEQGMKSPAKAYYLRARTFYLKASCKDGVQDACTKLANLKPNSEIAPENPIPSSRPSKFKNQK